MKSIILMSLFSTLALMGESQTGKVFDDLSMESKILGMERKYAVYLPPDYESSQRSYPVLYLLHGGGDDHTDWIQFGEVLRIADRAILEGTATPMVMIMPDAGTLKKGFFNYPGGEWDYEDFFFNEFIPHVERTFRIKAEKRYRAVAGLSMGGGGTFIYALHHPELFSSACPLSASCSPLTPEDVDDKLRGYGISSVSREEKSRFFEQYGILHLVRTLPAEDLKSVRWYIDCGDDDFLFEGNSLIHIEMRKRGVPHEYRVRDGRHTWTYWRESLPEVLRFVSDHYHQH